MSTIEQAIAAVPQNALLAFLGRQRWFAAKGATPTASHVDDCVVVPWGGGAFAIARVTVDTDGRRRVYQVPLAARDATPSGIPESSVVASVGAEPALTVYDAVHDEEFRAGLARALVTGASVAGKHGTRWVVEPVVPGTGTVSGGTRVGSAEQSNTSITIDGHIILKLFRTLNPGTHPDVEVTRFLTVRAGFRNTPRLTAAIRFEDGDIQTTAGMAQQYLPGSSDAWSYALERGRAYFAAAQDREPPNAFIDDAKKLGAVTRAMHEALASDDDNPDFAPEPVEPGDLDRWAQKTQRSLRDAMALLERQLTTLPKERIEEAQALVRRKDHFTGWINELADQIGDDLGMRTRTHGDYHLGQVLRTRDGDFMIIDFEGEPSRSLEERREKTSPLRDVAGMLRSFGYAAATLAMETKNIQPHTREIRAGRWERDVRAAYLAGYLESGEDEALLPDDEAHARQLISLFEAEKAFYELSYELNNRPTWAWIPMRGISKLLSA